MFFVKKTVGTVALSNNDETEHEMKILQNITKQLYWNSIRACKLVINIFSTLSLVSTEGIPNDSIPIPHIVTVSVPVTVLFTIAGVAGIVFALVFATFNFINRKKRYIQTTSYSYPYKSTYNWTLVLSTE